MERKPLTNEEKLDAIYEMTLDNHHVLRSLRRQQYVANAFRVVYWLVVLGAIGGSYYYVRPLILAISNNSSKVEETFTQIDQLKNQLPETKVIRQIFEGMKKGDQKEPAPQEAFEVVPQASSSTTTLSTTTQQQ